MWRIRIAFFNFIKICRIFWYIRKLERSNQKEIYLFTEKDGKRRKFDILDAFEPRAEIRTKYFSQLKNKLLKEYYIKVEEQGESEMKGIESDVIDYDITKYYIGKYLRQETDLLLYSINKTTGTATFLKKNQAHQGSNSYFHYFYHILLTEIDTIDYTILDRIPSLIDGTDSSLWHTLELNFCQNKTDVHFMNAAEYLNLYPVETIKNQVIKHHHLIHEFCRKHNLIFCYSEEFEYDKKERKYIQILDYKSPKIGFILQGSFDEWRSQESFYYQGKTDDGLFHQYKVIGENPLKEGYLLEHILVEQFIL